MPANQSRTPAAFRSFQRSPPPLAPNSHRADHGPSELGTWVCSENHRVIGQFCLQVLAAWQPTQNLTHGACREIYRRAPNGELMTRTVLHSGPHDICCTAWSRHVGES